MPNTNFVPNWTFERTLPSPFDSYSGKSAVMKDIASKYCNQPKKRATLHSATLQAVFSYMNLENPPAGKAEEELGAIGSQANNFTIAEYPSRTGLLHVVVYNRMTGKFIAGKYEKPLDLDSKPEPYQFKKDEDSGSALYFALMPTFLSDDEFNEKYQELKQHRDDGFPDLPKAAETAAVLCDNVYRRIRYGDSLPIGNIKVDTPANGVLQRLTPLNIQKGVYAPTEIIQGTFQVLKGGHHYTASAVSIPKEDFVDKYILSNSRTLTPQEESTVPILEDWYVIPKEIQRICEHAKLTTDSKQPMRNFMLRGPAGTGKTEGAKAIAAGLHLPYRCITCSANTEIFDLLGQILPDVDEKQLSLVGELPSFQDITLDPATAYEKLTGTYDEKVSENTVYEELIHHISEEMKQKQAATSSSQQFRYVDTPLVEAIRNGYLVEIQEPTVIANPGVLVGLNSLLDRCNSVFLPNGEVIHRHPDTTIVVTTNHDYAGCRPMNQSVISRMNMVIDMDEPDEETMVERVLAITGCSDKKSVRTMTQIVRSIAQYCQDNLITDGCCGVRELIAILVGDMRLHGKFYSMQNDLMRMGDFESFLVKGQFNCVSDNRTYKKPFIPIVTEYALLLKKTDSFIIPFSIRQEGVFSVQNTDILALTWHHLIRMTMESIGGRGALKDLYDLLKEHPKAKKNPHYQERIRATLYEHPDEYIPVSKGYFRLSYPVT